MRWCEKLDHYLPFPVFGLCLSEESYLKEMRRIKVKNHGPWMKTCTAHATAHTFDGKEGLVYIIITLGPHKGKSHPAVYGLLAHEATHIWQEVRKMMGEDEPSSEFEAYTMQFICTQLFHAYEELKRKRLT